MTEITNDYLLDKKVRMFQSKDGYKTSSDAVLVSSLVNNIKANEKILDIGSGTGGISLCLAHRFPQAFIYGFEIQPELAELSNMSAKENGFSNLEYIVHDIKEKKAPLPFGSFDHVITNPPYAKSGSKSPNKSKATAHNQQDIDLKGWLSFCLKMLKPYGFLYLIHRAEALDEILSVLYQKAGNIRLVPIYSKTNEKAKRVMLIAQKDSKTPLSLLPPLTVHLDGAYSFEAEQILRGGKSFFEIDIQKR
ncbi:MAG: methyltransferase domain-containing protein [Alphaproteobacteria bacterium]|nr:methyltransferase domain-containing protein [Alphaproteobacteria bacterium]